MDWLTRLVGVVVRAAVLTALGLLGGWLATGHPWAAAWAAVGLLGLQEARMMATRSVTRELVGQIEALRLINSRQHDRLARRRHTGGPGDSGQPGS